MGLMQIMPETWVDLRPRYQLGADPYDAHDNIMAGAAYLRELYDRYGIPGFTAAYDAGPARWQDRSATHRPLPMETRRVERMTKPPSPMCRRSLARMNLWRTIGLRSRRSRQGWLSPCRAGIDRDEPDRVRSWRGGL